MENKLERMEDILLGWMEFLYEEMKKEPGAYNVSDCSKYLAEIGKVELEVRCYLDHTPRFRRKFLDKVSQS